MAHERCATHGRTSRGCDVSRVETESRRTAFVWLSPCRYLIYNSAPESRAAWQAPCEGKPMSGTTARRTPRPTPHHMEPIDYYNDQKYCPSCEDYVPYLMSVEHSYCTCCGGEVRLFSKTDWENFQNGLSAKRPKGGRPRKKTTTKSNPSTDRESA